MSSRPASRGVSRREFVQAAGLGLGALVGGALLGACSSPAPAAAPTAAPAAPSNPAGTPGAVRTAAPTVQAKPFAGQSISVSLFDTAYPRGLEKLIPQFEEQTGIKVQYEMLGFTVYLQRGDLELSGAAGAVDVMALVFAQSGRWIGANWAENLAPFITKSAFDLQDFLPGPLSTMKRGDSVFGIPWLADSQLMLYRKDLISQPPATFDELLDTAKKVHSASVGGYMPAGKAGLNWVFPTFLFGFGGKVFANPPTDLTPGYGSEQAIKAADYWAGNLIKSFGVPGSINFEDAEGIATMQQGRAAIWIHSLGQLTAALDPQKSTVADKVAFASPPQGPAGRFPQVASHGFMIPVASRKKDAGWEFVRWASSKETMRTVALNSSFAAVTRASVLNDPEFKKKFQLGGSDVPALHEAALKATGPGYMAYRTVAEFPPISDRVVIALSEIATGQKPAADAMKQANADIVQILQKAGHKVS